MSELPAAFGAESIHGHTILRWLAERPMSLPALEDRVAMALGTDARFHTCDSAGLALTELIALLAERGKIVRRGDAWIADLSRMCDDA